MTVLPAYVYVHQVYACCPWRSGEGVRSLATEPLCGCWELDLGPLQAQELLSTERL